MKNVNTENFWNRYHQRPDTILLNYPIKFKHISQELLKNFPEGSRLLDIGCGRGALLFQLKKDHPTWILEGLDFSEVVVDFLNKSGFLCRKGFLPEILKNLPKYDIILGTEILEHLPDSERLKTTKYISKLLNKNGLAIFTVPDNVLPNSEESSHLICYNKNSFKDFLKQTFPISKVYSKEYLVSNKRHPKKNKVWGYCPFLIGECRNI